MAKKKEPLLLSPSRKQLRETENRLPRFDPIDLRSLLALAGKRTGAQSADGKVLIALRDRIEEQTEELLRGLGCDPAEFNWQIAFIRLARIHHGLGRLAYAPKRTNSKGAEKWKNEHTLRLLTVMRDLKAEGIEGAAAFEKIAKDPKLREQFPYATRSQIKGKDQMAKSLSERWRKLFLEKDPLRKAIGGDQPLGKAEFLLWSLDNQYAFPAVAKNKNA
jgi:hypothetical protein